MARGQVSKQTVAKKILEVFEGSFSYNDGKEIRIPLTEDGELIQIKVALTAAKDNVEPGDENALPGAAAVNNTNNEKIEFGTVEKTTEPVYVEPTAEEKRMLVNY